MPGKVQTKRLIHKMSNVTLPDYKKIKTIANHESIFYFYCTKLILKIFKYQTEKMIYSVEENY